MYEIILYDTEDGRCPVQELLDSLEPKSCWQKHCGQLTYWK